MNTFAIYVALRAESPLDGPSLEIVERGLRPDDEEMCVWRDEQDDFVLRLSTDVRAEDYEAAADAGRVIAAEALRLAPVPARVQEVVSMTEQGQFEWRPH